MADLQARIGPKVTKQYPHRTWKRPGADLQSPSKNTVKWSQARQSDEKDDDSDASSREHASSPTLSSPTKSKHRSSPQRRDSGGQLSLLTRMGLSSGVSEDGASEGREAVGMQQSLLPRVGTTEDTPRFSPNIGSTRDSVHDPDSNGYHDTANSKHASPQHPLPSSLNGQRNIFVAEKRAPDDRDNRVSHNNSNSGQMKYNNKSSQEQDFEDGEPVDSEPLPSQQVRDFLLPLVLKNAAHRAKEGDNDLTRLTAHSVLSDEVCSSFMDQMKEVRTEMHAHKNRSSTNLQMPLMGETNMPRVVPSSKISQAPPVDFPLVASPGQRWSLPLDSSQPTYIRDVAFRESPEIISGRRSVSPPEANTNNRMERQSISCDLRHIERPSNISPRWDTAESPRSPVSRRNFGRRGADEVVSPRQPSFTHDRGLESSRRRRDSCVDFARSDSRRSASPRRKQDRQFSAERPLSHMPLSHLPRSATDTYCPSSSSFEPERRRDWSMDHHMESVSSEAGSMSHRTSRASGSRHPTPKLMVIDNKGMHERVNDEIRTPRTSDDMPKSRPDVLPCHNVPGVWFVKAALGDIGILECSFEVDDATALNWNLRPANVNLPNKANILRKEKLQLRVCCLSQKDVQSVMDSLKPYATAQDVASAMLTIENVWPTPGHLIIMVNPQDKNKRVWLPDKLDSPCLPACIEDYVVEGQNIVQFIQLSGMSERMFVLFANTRPLSDELQHDDEGFIFAPLQNTIDGEKKDTFGIRLEQVVISDLK